MDLPSSFVLLQTFPKKARTWKDRLLVFPLMLTLTLPRMFILGMTLSLLNEYGCIAIGCLVLFSLIVSVPYFKYDPQKALLGAISSLFAPCIVFDEHTKYFLITSLASTSSYIILSLSLPFMICFNVDHIDIPEIFSSTRNTSFVSDVCLGVTEEKKFISKFFFGINIIMLILFVLSIGSSYILHRYLDPIFRYYYASWFHDKIFNKKYFTPMWNKEQILWLPFLRRLYLYPDNCDDIDKEVNHLMGSSLIEFATEMGQLQLTKVSNVIYVTI